MGEWTTLRAADGHEFAAWKSARAEPLAGLVVVQEIFGVNAHVRQVADRYASLGFAAVAPALFDRAARGVELGYDEADIARGRELRGRFSWDLSLLDLAAAAESVRFAGRVGIIGYCWGGSMAWRLAASESSRQTYKRGGDSPAAAKIPVDAAVCYYGAQIVDYLAEKPQCPTLLIFGDEDTSIPPETVAAIRAAHPGIEAEIYPGPHGFACDHRAAFRAESARGAFARSFEFLARRLRPAP
jgi:carboxymethylenebutenolidase